MNNPIVMIVRDESKDFHSGELTVEEREIDVTTEAVEYNLHTKLRTLLADAAQARQVCDSIQRKPDVTLSNLASTQTAMRDMQRDVARLSQITEVLVRRLVAIARLTVGALDDTADT